MRFATWTASGYRCWMYSVSMKIFVSFGSNPIAMMSRMLSYAIAFESSS